ncbi:MAG: putative toxin-antitoxin system toxin component, PIN family [Acidobacteriota bacterium]
MRLVVLDTNVVISAGIGRPGPPARIMDEWILGGRVQVLTCPAILIEYRDVTARTKLRRYGFPPRWLDVMIEDSLQLPDPPAWPHPLPDAKNAPFLSLARTSGAWLVTGNLKHFPRAARNGVTVLSPADYLAHLLQ